MPVNIDAEGAKRTDYDRIPPYSILVTEEARGRRFPPEPQVIIDLAIDMLRKPNFQTSPVSVRKYGDGDKVCLAIGFTRMAAARMIVDGFEHDGVFYHQPDFLLKAFLLKGNATDALKSNLSENRFRNATTPIDDAHNQEKLRNLCGMDNKEIAEFYRVPVATIARNERLLGLSDEHQLMVHQGVMDVTGALLILDRPEPERAEIIEAATVETPSGKPKVKTGAVRGQVRDKHLRDTHEAPAVAPATPKAKGKTPEPRVIPHTFKEVREWFEAASTEDSPRAEFAKVVVLWMNGQTTDAKMLAAWEEL